MKGNLKRWLSGDGAVVCAVLDGTEMCREMERIHKTSAVCTAALGRLSMAASLIGYFTGPHLIVINKEPIPADERATLLIRADIDSVFRALQSIEA